MLLKVKSLKLSAGRPVAILHAKTARHLDVHVDERVEIIKSKTKKTIAVMDTALLDREDEIVLSEEIIKKLKLKEGDFVDVSTARRPVSVLYIRKKLDGKKLNKKEIFEIVRGIVENRLTEAEIAYFVSAAYKEGMSLEEMANLTRAIKETGNQLGLKNKIIADKHGIGGVAGNRTTPLVVSICAAAGLVMPKTSSRAITSAGGTADVIETIAKVEFGIEELRGIIKKTNACLVWGGALGLAPADDKLIQVERLLHLDPESQIVASILAKKLSVGATHVILDIPYGKFTKVTKKQAMRLEKIFSSLAKIFKIKLKVILKREEQPIGNGIGPVMEMRDVISVLQQKKDMPKDLEKRSLLLSSHLLELTGKARKGEGKKIAEQLLKSGKAYKKFLEIITAQQGRIKSLRLAKLKKDIRARKSGIIKEINGKDLMAIVRTAGAPADKVAGLYLYKHCKEKIARGEKLLTIYAENKDKLRNAEQLYKELLPIKIKK